jgi:hypothetical protein
LRRELRKNEDGAFETEGTAGFERLEELKEQ